jgi:hypothetical protein
MNARLFPLLKHVALDGFYKYPDGTVKPMPDDECYDFDLRRRQIVGRERRERVL